MKKGFMNQYHEQTFEKAIVKLDKNNNMLMSAVYLLTVDSKLWKQCKKHIEGNRICFDAFKPVSCKTNDFLSGKRKNTTLIQRIDRCLRNFRKNYGVIGSFLI